MPYVSNTDRDREEMLRTVGVSSIEDLLASIPGEMRLSGALDIPGPMSELALARHVAELASLNAPPRDVISFLGGGVYDHAMPAVVKHVTGMPQFYTAYTPYQAEASQGTLQTIYEYQTLVARLTGMEVANASMYDGASAAAEAALMSLGMSARTGVIVSESVSPAVRSVVRTYLCASGSGVQEVPARQGVTDLSALGPELPRAACLLVQQPNYFGLIEPMQKICEAADAAGAHVVAVVDPVSLALLAPPGEYGATIAVGEGQRLGSAVGFGGPLLGFMAASRRHIRELPGRIIGAATDARGRRGYVMTLQTREQHIRRGKATSNICTNQALNALAAAVYLCALGKEGLRELATQIVARAHYAASSIAGIEGARMRFPGRFFGEFVVQFDSTARVVVDRVAQAGIWPGIDLGRHYPGMDDCLLVSVTELHTRADIDSLVCALEAAIRS